MTNEATTESTAAPVIGSGVAAAAWRWLGRAWQRCEDGLTRLTDDFNPILVKETRQALKSRQFVVSFLIVLVACWIVTIGGIAIIGPEVYWGAAGLEMLMAYFVVLAVPLTIIVPYSAFRSLAVEKEENTYDLLSITTLGSRQIITGKLASSAAQMLVYFSAVAPCIAFTLLLRGVDALTIGILLAMLVAGSMALAMTALLVGTLSHVKYSQVVLSVGLVIGLVLAFWGAVALAYVLLEEGAALYAEEGFWLAVLLLSTVYVTTFGMFHAAATARITFSSENRSTPLRKWMMAQQGCFFACVAAAVFFTYKMFGFRQGLSLIDLMEPIVVISVAALMYWYLMGTLVTSEWPHLSRRVQRSLPQSLLGRTFLSWFNPGPSAGYVFAVANYSFVAASGFAMVVLADWGRVGGNRTVDAAWYFYPISWGYLTAFLGAGRLAIGALRRFTFVPLAAGFLTHLILLLFGIGVPMVFYLMSPSSRYLQNYSLSQITNPALTLGKLLDDGPDSIDAVTVSMIVVAAGVLMLLANARSIATELFRQRTPIPIRLVEDNEAERARLPNKPQSPWDEEEPAEPLADG